VAGSGPPGRSPARRLGGALWPCGLIITVAACGAVVTPSRGVLPSAHSVPRASAGSTAPVGGRTDPSRIDPCSLLTAAEFSADAHAAVQLAQGGLNAAGTVALCPFVGADETAADGTVITDGGFVGVATAIGPLTTFVATYGLPLGPDCTVVPLLGAGEAAFVQRCPEYAHTGDIAAWRGGLTVQLEVSGARLSQDAAVAGATDLIRRALARLP
jgi:hypothetical protein